MKSLVLGLVVALFLASPVYGQTARDKIKNDPQVKIQGLTDEELKDILDIEQDRIKHESKEEKARKVRERILKMYQEDAQLKDDLKKDK